MSFVNKIPYKVKGVLFVLILWVIYFFISDHYNAEQYKTFYKSAITDVIVRVQSEGRNVRYYTTNEIKINSTVIPGRHIELKVGDSISKLKNSTKFKVFIRGANGKYTYRNTSNYIRG
jgi:hypothetical protein